MLGGKRENGVSEAALRARDALTTVFLSALYRAENELAGYPSVICCLSIDIHKVSKMFQISNFEPFRFTTVFVSGTKTSCKLFSGEE